MQNVKEMLMQAKIDGQLSEAKGLTQGVARVIGRVPEYADELKELDRVHDILSSILTDLQAFNLKHAND
jgi:hypothetical protein